MRRVTIAIVLVSLATSCDFTQYNTLMNEAGDIALSVPDGYSSQHYGAVVAGWSGTLSATGPVVSRVGITAGVDSASHAGSQLRILPFWDGNAVDLRTPTFVGCHVASECAMGAGSSMIGIQSWGLDQLCMVAGAPGGSAIQIHCETEGPMLLEQLNGTAGTGFGASLAPLPPHFAGGALVVGAPQAGTGSPPSGGLFVVSGPGAAPVPLALGAATTSAVAIGTRLASAAMPSGDVLIATTAPARIASRVIVLLLHADGTPEVRACIDYDVSHPNAAGAIALGDLDGDHVPDLVVGDDAGMASRRDNVEVFFGRDLPTATGCGAWGATATSVSCPDNLRGRTCAGSGFGGALAIGDVNDDGFGDLVIGAMLSNAPGAPASGAVYLVPGSASGPVTASTSMDVLTDSSPKDTANLGASVAVAPSRRTRSEVIAGAPGANEAIVFLCSGLAGDGVTVDRPRCIPAT